MEVSPFAGKLADPSILIDVSRLVSAHYTGRPDPSVPAQRVAFGASGHRGCSLDNSFNEEHIYSRQSKKLKRQHPGYAIELRSDVQRVEFGSPDFHRTLV